MKNATDLIPRNALLEETVSVCLFLLDSTIDELKKEEGSEAVVYRLKLARNNLGILASLEKSSVDAR